MRMALLSLAGLQDWRLDHSTHASNETVSMQQNCPVIMFDKTVNMRKRPNYFGSQDAQQLQSPPPLEEVAAWLSSGWLCLGCRMIVV